MYVSDPSLVIAGVGVVIGGVGLYMGVPARRLAQIQQRHAEAAERDHKFQDRVWRAITGSDPDAGTSPAKPSLMDMMKDTRDNTRNMSKIQAMMAHHVSDNHGGKIPAYLFYDADADTPVG